MKLLVIVSRDYGELGNAMHFLDHVAFGASPTLMLPTGMKAPGLDAGKFDIRGYATLADIRQAVLTTTPDVVMLFSGYLLAIGRHFSLLNALRLLRFLRRRGVTVLTSDPFIGLIRSPLSLDFSAVLEGQLGTRTLAQRLAVPVLARVLSLRLYLMFRNLRDVCHVYPAPIAAAQTRLPLLQLSYFNPHANRPLAPAQASPAVGIWLFTLSRVDCAIQTQRHGARFVEILSARLGEAARHGRKAILIATPELLAELRPLLPAGADIELRAEDSYAGYMQTVMQAEYAFFWNYFSFSIIHRVIASLPVFYFDEGHMVSILPALSHEGIRSFYGGWRPPLLSLTRPLDPLSLAAEAQEVRRQFTRIAHRLEQGLSPLALLQQVHRSRADKVSG